MCNERPNILWLMVGLPRSGKTTAALQLAKDTGAPIVNPDAIRLAIHGKPYLQSAEPFVWATAHAMVDSLFLAGHADVILDACNNTRKRRDEWKYGKHWAERRFITIDCDVEICLNRLGADDAKAMAPVIQRMAEQHEPVKDDEK